MSDPTSSSASSASGSADMDHSPAYTTSFVPFTSPPTPSPSPGPRASKSRCPDRSELALLRDVRVQFQALSTSAKHTFLAELLACCPVETLVHVSNIITPRIKRDFLRDLPTELSLHIVSFLDDAQTLARASAVSRHWHSLLCDEYLWKCMCKLHKYCIDRRPGMCCSPRARVVRRLSITDSEEEATRAAAAAFAANNTFSDSESTVDLDMDSDERIAVPPEPTEPPQSTSSLFSLPSSHDPSMLIEPFRALSSSYSSQGHTQTDLPPRLPAPSSASASASTSTSLVRSTNQQRKAKTQLPVPDPSAGLFSYKQHFKVSYLTETNWRLGGRVVRAHTFTQGTVTNVSIDSEWIIAALTNSKVYVFSAKTGAHVRNLVGHSQGVWALHLVSKGGRRESELESSCTSTNSGGAAAYGSGGREGDRGTGSGWMPGSFSRSQSGYSTPQPHQFGSSLGLGLGLGGLHPNSSTPALPGISPPVSPDPHTYPHNLRSSLPASSTSSLPSSSSARGSTTANGKRCKGKERDLPPLPEGLHERQSDVCNASYGWGQEGALALSGSCDRELRVWDVRSGFCLHILRGHTSTIRCVKALDGRPVAVSASRDGLVRVWDIQKGICLRVLEGHTSSVRSLDVAGNVCVTASYDTTARMWNVDTGECLRIFRGHQQQIYSVAFDGRRVATGSLDSTVRLWDAETGECLTLLQGHTSLVGNVQILDDDLVTGGSDGRVIVFSLKTYATRLRICAHDNSVTTLQVDAHYLVTGGNDGCVKLFDRGTGALVRELTEPCEGVWKVLMRRDKCVIMCKRGGNTVVEILGFAPTPEQL